MGVSRACGDDESTGLTDLVRRAAPELNCGDELALSVLQYKPERRCALKLTLAGRSAAAIKCYAPKGYQSARRQPKPSVECAAIWDRDASVTPVAME